MPSGLVNFVTTCLLTLVCIGILYLLYRHAVAPMLKRHDFIALRNLSWAISDRYHTQQAHYRWISDQGGEEIRLSQELERGFRGDSASDQESVGERINREEQGMTSRI